MSVPLPTDLSTSARTPTPTADQAAPMASTSSNPDGVKTKVILVGIGGATCSGKTTLAKHLRRILPNSVIIHQDDFAPPQELVPMHPVYNVQDWDAAPGAIDWPRLVAFLRTVKHTGAIPPDHSSHDHLNEQRDVPLAHGTEERWRGVFAAAARAADERGEKVVWGLVDGFLLYWHPDVIAQLDVRLFLRVPHDVLRQRRHERHGYHTAEGTLWRDPPHYWEQIVYPAYVDAHGALFVGGDVERGLPTGEIVPGLVVLESLEMDMDEVVERSCEVVVREVRAV